MCMLNHKQRQVLNRHPCFGKVVPSKRARGEIKNKKNKQKNEERKRQMDLEFFFLSCFSFLFPESVGNKKKILRFAKTSKHAPQK